MTMHYTAKELRQLEADARKQREDQPIPASESGLTEKALR